MREAAAPSPARLPRQIPYIIGNEACERFSFYGMRNILTVFLIDWLLKTEIPERALRESEAKSVFHLFVSSVYFFPLLGGWLADRFFGRYRVILWLSILYVGGHACLALFEDDKRGFFVGLALIALGSGGIKPCVSAMVGDQFDASSKGLAAKVFAAFYWSINFGSFFASLLMPKTLKWFGPGVAFGVPGVLMAIAVVVFWAGRKHYVLVPPTGPNPHGFFRVVGAALRGRFAPDRAPVAHWLDRARAAHPDDAVEGAKAVFRLLLLFAPIPFFWMLFDQKASTWVVQARAMDPKVGSWTFEPAQMQVVNPALVMILIPLMTGTLYPLAKRLGWELTPLRRMPLGMAVGALSYVVAGLLQIPVGRGESMSILWQLAPYVLLTTAEILVSTTGLEFAYSQAPRAMKATLMSLWSLTVTAGNLAVALSSALNVFSGASQFFFFAAMAGLASVALALIARRFVVADQYRSAS